MVNIAICQNNIIFEKKQENIEAVHHFISEASEKHADIIVFPEMSFTGFTMNVPLAGEEDSETLNTMCEMAARYHIAIGFGWLKKIGIAAENHYTVVDSEGRVVSDYTKMHPFSFSGEDKVITGGNDISDFMFQNVCMSTFICYDLRFPEIFQIASDKASVIIVAANWPSVRLEHWKILLQARALENQAYFIAVNCCGIQNGIRYSGGSGIYSPEGRCVAYCGSTEKLLIYALDDDTAKFRSEFPLKKDRKPKLYRSFL